MSIEGRLYICMYATNDKCDVHCSTPVTSYCGNVLSWFHQPHIMLLDFDVHCSMKFLVFGSRGSWVCEHLTELWGDRESWCSVKQTLPGKILISALGLNQESWLKISDNWENESQVRVTSSEWSNFSAVLKCSKELFLELTQLKTHCVRLMN